MAHEMSGSLWEHAKCFAVDVPPKLQERCTVRDHLVLYGLLEFHQSEQQLEKHPTRMPTVEHDAAVADIAQIPGVVLPGRIRASAFTALSLTVVGVLSICWAALIAIQMERYPQTAVAVVTGSLFGFACMFFGVLLFPLLAPSSYAYREEFSRLRCGSKVAASSLTMEFTPRVGWVLAFLALADFGVATFLISRWWYVHRPRRSVKLTAAGPAESASLLNGEEEAAKPGAAEEGAAKVAAPQGAGGSGTGLAADGIDGDHEADSHAVVTVAHSIQTAS